MLMITLWDTSGKIQSFYLEMDFLMYIFTHLSLPLYFTFTTWFILKACSRRWMPSPSSDIWILLLRSGCWIFTNIGPLCYNCMPEVSMLIKTDKPNRSEAAHWSFITLVIWTSDLRDVGNAICCYFHSYLKKFFW